MTGPTSQSQSRIVPALPYGRRAARGFSLIELLVVIGLIVVLLAGTGLALQGHGSDGKSLQAAQGILASLVGSTRTQAVLQQTRTRLLIYGAPPPGGDAEKYLRYLQVVREEPFGSNTWVSVGAPITLPAGVYIVPPSGITTTGGVTWNTNTTNGPISLFSTSRTATAMVVDGQPFGGATGRLAFYVEYTSDGRPVDSFVGTNIAPKLALATATPSLSAAPAFNNSSGVRGLLLRSSGAVTRVNDATSF